MLRRALLPGSSSLVARKAATMVNSVTATRMAAVASPVRPVSSIFRRLYSSEQNSDPRKHPRDLDDDFEEVDPRKAATNQQGEAAEEPEVLIMDIAAENLQQVIAASPFPLIVFLYAPKYVRGDHSFRGAKRSGSLSPCFLLGRLGPYAIAYF